MGLNVWKSAETIPVPKISPARSIQSDLRPIALLPVVAKVFESFVREWLLHSLSLTFDAFQFGGLKGRSTAHALTSHLCYIRGSPLWTTVTLLGSCWLISARPSTMLIIIYYFRNYWTAMFLTAFCDGSFLICLTENRERVSIAKDQTGSTLTAP